MTVIPLSLFATDFFQPGHQQYTFVIIIVCLFLIVFPVLKVKYLYIVLGILLSFYIEPAPSWEHTVHQPFIVAYHIADNSPYAKNLDTYWIPGTQSYMTWAASSLTVHKLWQPRACLVGPWKLWEVYSGPLEAIDGSKVAIFQLNCCMLLVLTVHESWSGHARNNLSLRLHAKAIIQSRRAEFWKLPS